MTPEQNHYEMLGVSSAASREEIEAAVEQLHRQAAAIANVSPERSLVLRERIRAIRQDLLSGPERRAAYDRGLQRLDPLDVPLTASRREPPPTQPIPRAIPVPEPGDAKPSSRMPRSIWLVALLVPLTAVVTIGLMRGLPVLGKSAAATATATLTPMPTTTATPTVRPAPTAVARGPAVAPSPISPPPAANPTPDTQAIIAAVGAYNTARKLRHGPTYDASQVDATTIGVARDAVMCLVDDDGKNLQNIGAYWTVSNESHGPQSVSINGSAATLSEYKSDTQTEYYADGTSKATDESFTVTYTLTNDGSGWKVSDYAWSTSGGLTGSAAQDASKCR